MKIGKWILMFLLVVAPVFSFGSTTYAKDPTKETTAYVDVSVLTVWVEPNIARDVDLPSLTNPVDPWKWTKNMTYEEKLWLVGKLETQALYGMKVHILEEQGDWVKIAVVGQPTPREEAGYPGWVPKEQLIQSKKFQQLERRPFATVTAPTAFLYSNQGLTKEFMEVSFNTRLPVLAAFRDRVLVMTPSDGTKWFARTDVEIYQSEDEIPAPTADDLLETAELFLDLPYLWAGVSGFGFDCSGFTHTIYRAHGITIPRDSSVQARYGTYVEREHLQKGDLVFFARNGGTGAVHHVGMYIGDGKMIHSPNSASTVEIVTIDESSYAGSYHSARRYLEE
ncbi:NlpC/P60 family protein [Halalkalibacterium halodurans]|uniref:Polysugar degrading enzyme (Alpha-amylase) n=1 Tax=Halalkalibacterium halodurans (strain ATCC BAA-125 / DSM 18197 / FERM 7344 / JCM 9153 / C-125) TaxID=272558 RepID=Q9K8J9_HALH5|nr:NlpC/P60 family protein [Halalkalibacterium halodurans]MED4080686.1 NlpC/P60 family protein [Halalkalibacterium halodurans]MED4087168.1 NlpC/P60 family protein [Halalkalibacterium halodurans]MED4104753.1 NlpC/P60 family protein [Halalkalibacterium halodurans]MED4111210.1 NlpC/P60 family protein [Halalkalibacterium halodurans]MED4123156.1 NlpC/P60 family protein [Halalkalibacterium halodurans]